MTKHQTIAFLRTKRKPRNLTNGSDRFVIFNKKAGHPRLPIGLVLKARIKTYLWDGTKVNVIKDINVNDCFEVRQSNAISEAWVGVNVVSCTY